MLHGQSIYNKIYLRHSSIVQMIIVIWSHWLLRVEVALAAGIQDLAVKILRLSPEFLLGAPHPTPAPSATSPLIGIKEKKLEV